MVICSLSFKVKTTLILPCDKMPRTIDFVNFFLIVIRPIQAVLKMHPCWLDSPKIEHVAMAIRRPASTYDWLQFAICTIFCFQPGHLAPQPLGVRLGLVMLSYEETADRKLDGIRLLANNLWLCTKALIHLHNICQFIHSIYLPGASLWPRLYLDKI